MDRLTPSSISSMRTLSRNTLHTMYEKYAIGLCRFAYRWSDRLSPRGRCYFRFFPQDAQRLLWWPHVHESEVSGCCWLCRRRSFPRLARTARAELAGTCSSFIVMKAANIEDRYSPAISALHRQDRLPRSQPPTSPSNSSLTTRMPLLTQVTTSLLT